MCFTTTLRQGPRWVSRPGGRRSCSRIRPRFLNTDLPVHPKKRMDNPAASASRCQIMSHQPATHSADIKLAKLTSPVSLAVDAVLVVAFFVFLFGLLKSHVPSNDPKMIFLWAGLTAACMSGVFWLAIQMFRVVLSAQRLAAKQKQ